MTIALVLSGGVGTRLATEIPKQYVEVGGKPVLSYSLQTLSAHPGIDAIQIVASPVWQPPIMAWMTGYEEKFHGFSLPGENRQLSIFHGLMDLQVYAGEDDVVLIHDAARPNLSSALISECLAALPGHDGVMPVLPMKDTVYLSKDRRTISARLNREQVFAGQAPEVFRLGAYCAANRRLLPDAILRINGASEPAVMAGLDVAMIPGDESNFKLTTPADLEKFQRLVAET